MSVPHRLQNGAGSSRPSRAGLDGVGYRVEDVRGVPRQPQQGGLLLDAELADAFHAVLGGNLGRAAALPPGGRPGQGRPGGQCRGACRARQPYRHKPATLPVTALPTRGGHDRCAFKTTQAQP